jgi:hypothetical protein
MPNLDVAIGKTGPADLPVLVSCRSDESPWSYSRFCGPLYTNLGELGRFKAYDRGWTVDMNDTVHVGHAWMVGGVMGGTQW